MTQSNYSYLDLTVMPFLRKKVISGDAAILFDSSFSNVLWANAIGADLFGGNGIFSLLEVELSDNHTLVKQLKNASRQLQYGEPIVRGFRIAHGLTSELIQGELANFTLPNHEKVILAVFKTSPKTQRLREYELASKAVDALDGFADAAAIVDDYGLVLASSKGFDTLEIDPDTLENLIAIVSKEDDRLVKRKVQTASGRMAAAGLGRIRDVPGRFIIVVADADEPQNATGDETWTAEGNDGEPSAFKFENTGEAEAEEITTSEPGLSDTNHPTAEHSDVEDALLPPWLDNSKPDDVVDEDDQGISVAYRDQADTDELFTNEHQARDEAIDEAEIVSEAASKALTDYDRGEVREEKHPAHAQSGSLLDRWYFSDEEKAEDNSKQETVSETTEIEPVNELVPDDASSETGPISDTVEVAAKSDNNAPAYGATPSEKPRRFAFVIDKDHVIQSVSAELQQTVGTHSGDISGKRWETIAASRKIDENGIIQKLLEKADTWSGKSVLWPVDGTDVVIPVDLAALPVYDRERNFDGFRGFGIIRVDDAIVDPNATGMHFKDHTDSEPALDESIEPSTDLFQDDIVTPETDPLEENWGGRAPVWQTDVEREDETASDETSEAAPVMDKTAAGNVFHLPSRQKKNVEEVADDTVHLSGKEKQAFSEISRSLSSEIENTEPEADFPEETNQQSSEEVHSFDNESLDKNQNRTDDSSILETLPVPLMIYRAEKTLFANEALLALTGYSSIDDIDASGGVDALFSRDDHVEEKSIKRIELKRKDGSHFYAQTKLTTVEWKGEKALCLAFDNAGDKQTDDKPALDMVRVSELENILETAADGILVLDEDGKVESLNASGEALFGCNQADIVGKSFGKLFATESRQSLEAYIKDLNTPGVSAIINQGLEVIGLEANGGMIPLFATIGRVGQSNRYCAVLRDLTEWKRNEEELVKAKHSAETASEQKSEFLSRMSHEIREPLNAIIGFSDVMIEERFGRIENERYREYLKDINRSGIHVLDLVNDLLDISKIEAGKLELSYEAVDLNQLAAETIALLQPQANNKRILIRTSLSRAVPKVVADARSIRQIILNLVSNAINHSPQNSQVIVSTTYEENSEVGLRIRDTGKGMNKEQLERALEPFSQVGEDRQNGGGTGLGLPLTKALVEANRAYFDLESTPGEGTIAHIQFPSQRVLAD